MPTTVQFDPDTRIAVVGPSRWESEVELFTGAGVRRTPVRYFDTEQIAEARSWIAE